jgi:predicted secreted hydrolase
VTRAVSGSGGRGRRRALAALTVAAVIALAACTGGGPILANPTLALPVPASPTPTPARAADPIPISLPRDDGPHDRLTEWWYYTGHLVTSGGRHFGFEAVIFRAERGDIPTTWASHLALTDEAGNRFLYAQRSQIGGPVDRSPRDGAGNPTGFDLVLASPLLTNGAPSPDASLWNLAGSNGHDRIQAILSSGEAAAAGGAFGLDLQLSSEKPPALHDGNGWIDFGPAGSSYYYSRTRLAITGSLTLDGASLAVTGIGWFDHQWGDFISVGGGGWDWYAVQLADGTDLTLSLVRAADGSFPLVYGTIVDSAGRATHLDRAAFTVTATGRWLSPKTGATYPAGWRIAIPGQRLEITLTPTVADQELDTRPSTGVAYWEGSQHVSATHDGAQVGGDAYVELTGYAPPGG